MQRLFGWTLTKRIRQYYNVWKSSVMRSCDKAFFHLERQHLATGGWKLRQEVGCLRRSLLSDEH